MRVSRTVSYKQKYYWNKELSWQACYIVISNVFRILNILQWYLILTTLLLPEPPHPSPASSCRPEDGPELAAHAPETATPETAENVESYVGFFCGYRIMPLKENVIWHKLLQLIWLICSFRISVAHNSGEWHKWIHFFFFKYSNWQNRSNLFQLVR